MRWPGGDRAAAFLAALLLAPAAGCGGQTGTIHIDLVTAPDSDLLSQIDKARATLSDPHQVTEAQRQDDGSLSLDLDIEAKNQGASVMIEGFDAAGHRIAIGFTPPLPISAIDADIAVYLGPPLAMAEAPATLDPPRSELGVARLPYGAILVGGRDQSGAPVTDVGVYDDYDHTLAPGVSLPAARAAPTVMYGESDFAYVFGGEGPDGQARGEAWRFDLSVPPAGAFSTMTSATALARTGASGVYLGSETFLVAGDPAVLVNGLGNRAQEYTGAPSLGDGIGALVAATVTPIVVVAGRGVGTSGAVLWASGDFSDLDAPPEVLRTRHAVTTLPGGRALVVGGADDAGAPLASAIVYDAIDDQFSVLDDFLATPRIDAAVAATSDYLIVAGGTDATGAILADAEVFDSQTLDPVAVVPLVVPRTGARAVALGTGQVLVAGGTDDAGAPIGALELFTPNR